MKLTGIFTRLLALTIVSLLILSILPINSAENVEGSLIELDNYGVYPMSDLHVYFPGEDYYIMAHWLNHDNVSHLNMKVSMKVEKNDELIFADSGTVSLGTDGYTDSCSSEHFQFPENGKYQITIELEDGLSDNDNTWELDVGGGVSPILSIDPPAEVKIGKKFTVQVTLSESATIGIYIAESDGSNKILIGDRECWDGAGTYHIECKIEEEDVQGETGDYQLVLERYGYRDDPKSAVIKVEGKNAVQISDEEYVELYIIIGIIAAVLIITIVLFIKFQRKKKDSALPPEISAETGTPVATAGTADFQRPPPCKNCQSGMTFVNEYDKWYCEKCNQYF